jgi:hypothetical protein
VRVQNSRYNTLRKNGKPGVIIRVRPGKSRQDKTGAYYGRWVEDGYNKGSRQVGGNEAVALGIMTRDEYRQKRAFYNSKRKTGQVRQGIRARAGGNRVEGQGFVKNTFNALKTIAADMIIQNGTAAALEAARDVRLR